MDENRRAAWESALAQLDRSEELPPDEHRALTREGVFKGLNKSDMREEAIYAVRYRLHGRDLSPRAPRGPTEAEFWFKIAERWGEERQAEKLRAMIEASTYDPDYWDTLHCIAIRLHAQTQPFPKALADWAIELHKGNLKKPPRRQNDKGRPHYANDARDSAYADVFDLLSYLGMEGKIDRYAAIAEVFGVSERTVSKAIKRAMQLDWWHLPEPWECWPLKTR